MFKFSVNVAMFMEMSQLDKVELALDKMGPKMTRGRQKECFFQTWSGVDNSVYDYSSLFLCV